MSRNLQAVTAAMNAYPWTRGHLSEGPDHAASYCAIGALLRYAGVPRARIANGTEVFLAEVYGPLLRAKYGISAAHTVLGIMAANDGAESRGEATWRVLGLVAGTVDAETFAPQVGTFYSEPQMPPAA
jgi:hypothetical protein